MKAFAPVLFIATLLFAAATCVGQRQTFPPLYGDFRDNLPGLYDNRPELNPNIHRPGPEARVLTKGPLAPSAADRANYASFLRLSNTGLIRLLPRSHKQSKFAQPDKRVTIRGGGAYYSFSFLTHEYGYGSDLELSPTVSFYGGTEVPPTYHLSVGFAGFDYGMLTNLGDVPLETLTKDDPRARFMVNYKPPRVGPEARNEFLQGVPTKGQIYGVTTPAEPGARGEQRRFREGVSIDGRIYKSKLPIQVNTTYLLRSIVYDESDVLVAFRVVREDSDHSLIIAWRMLKKFTPPRITNSR